MERSSLPTHVLKVASSGCPGGHDPAAAPFADTAANTRLAQTKATAMPKFVVSRACSGFSLPAVAFPSAFSIPSLLLAPLKPPGSASGGFL